jgi:MoaA/NifB/PqqE/SkfB family radical SAM enzyme
MVTPKQVIIEATSRCNLQCKYCPSICGEGYPQGDMSFEFFKSIVDRIDFDTTVIPWMNGEPFLNPEYLKFVQYLNEKKQRFYVTTNLTVFREDVIIELLKEGSSCYQLIVSMDGLFGLGNIPKARPGTDEKQLRANIERLLYLKNLLSSKTKIAFKICERGQDWSEIERYIQYWLASSALDYVCVGKPLKDTNDETMRTSPCQYADHNFMVIRWDGKLVVCAYNDEAANKGKLSYGTVTRDNNLLELYNNEKIAGFRASQNDGFYPEPCDKCAFAYTGLGFQGQVEFRDDPNTVYYFHQDYYNSFFSKKKEWKPNSYYGGVDPPKEA